MNERNYCSDMYEVFEHTADLGLRVKAASLNDLMADAATGLFSMIVVNLDDVKPVVTKTYRIAGNQPDYLLFDWLTELLYTFDTERLVLADFKVHVDESGLVGTCRGEPIDSKKHDLDHEVKAITYHQLKVNETEAGWLAELIVDI